MHQSKLTVIARILAKPEKREFVKTELLKLIDITRAEEGCIDYILHQDNNNENLFLFYENWENKELWQAHINNAHMVAFIQATEGTLAEFIVHEMSEL